MKGVILAGGAGTRLFPCTKVTNKHLLPVYDRPMIYYPIQNMIQAGIEDILVLPGKDHAGDFAKLLGSGKDFNARFTFKIQDHAGGLAYAVGLAEDFVGQDNFLVIFGDNIIDYDFSTDVKNFKTGAQIFCKQVTDPQRFGVAEVSGDQVIDIIEKPTEPKSNWAVIGAYLYDHKAFDYIKTIKPSARGELEITDLNNIYIQKQEMKAAFLQKGWYDTGTHESLAQAAYDLMVAKKPAAVLKLDQKNSPLIGVGIILRNSAKYLPILTESLKRQDYKNLQLYAIDNNDDKNNDDVKIIQQHCPEIKIISPNKNVGFAAAHNLMIEQAIKEQCEFYIALNPDLLLEDNFISELVNAINQSPKAGSATGKIKKWDFAKHQAYDQGKTNFIDTAGLVITKEHRFLNRGENDIDYGQYDSAEEVFGSSGSAVIYRINALKDSAFINENGKNEYFDELMFMYKEDVDLAYRLQLAGYKCFYNPQAVAYHDRTISSAGEGFFNIVRGRLKKNRQNKEWSLLNHHIILQKITPSKFSSSVFVKSTWYEFKTLFYIILFEPFLLKQYWQLFKLRNKIKQRRNQIKERVDVKNIEEWMK